MWGRALIALEVVTNLRRIGRAPRAAIPQVNRTLLRRSAPLVRPAARLLVVPRWLYLGQRTSEVRWPTRVPTCDHEGHKVQEPSWTIHGRGQGVAFRPRPGTSHCGFGGQRWPQILRHMAAQPCPGGAKIRPLFEAGFWPRNSPAPPTGAPESGLILRPDSGLKMRSHFRRPNIRYILRPRFAASF